MCRRMRRRFLSLLRCRTSAEPEARRFWPPFRAVCAVEREGQGRAACCGPYTPQLGRAGGRGPEVARRRDRTTRRGSGRALDGQARGAALVDQDGATRATGSGLGQGGTGTRAETEACEARSRPRGGIGTTGSSGASSFKGGQGGQLSGQPADGLGPGHGKSSKPSGRKG